MLLSGGILKKLAVVSVFSFLAIYVTYSAATRLNLNSAFEIGETVDSLDGVDVYYNGGVNNVVERNVSKDGYNLGLKYQCVEFVKRYYYEHYAHRMTDSYGQAKDFFDVTVTNGALNIKRGLYQFTNGKGEQPRRGDILVLKPTIFNRFGHVSIVATVDASQGEVEVIQQNPGPFSGLRETYSLSATQPGAMPRFDNDRVLGWLRK